MILENAIKIANLGISVIPIQYRDKRPDFRLIPYKVQGDDGVLSPTWEPYKSEIPSLQTLQSWFATGQHNFGIIAGWLNLVVIDFDDMQEYRAWVRWASQTGGVAYQVYRTAYQVATARGVHLYIRLPNRQKNRKLGKIDIKGNGYVLGPGSIHPSGAEYRALRDTFNLPLVQALSDILPAALLITQTPVTVPPSVASWTVSAASPQPITGSLVEKIKRAYPIETMFPNARRSGTRHLLTCCPLHDDKNPSMWIDTQNQICGCFAGCTDKPLDIINLMARLNGLTNHDAIKFLAEHL